MNTTAAGERKCQALRRSPLLDPPFVVQNPWGRSPTTPSDCSSAIPALAIVPSSNRRPINVTPCGTQELSARIHNAFDWSWRIPLRHGVPGDDLMIEGGAQLGCATRRCVVDVV